MELSNFIKTLKLDEQKRIIVAVHEFLETYLTAPENRKMIKDGLVQILGENFKQLEIGKNNCRITVTEGTEEACLAKLEADLKSGIDMAMNFMANQSGEGPLN